jgi:hypothetical protein
LSHKSHKRREEPQDILYYALRGVSGAVGKRYPVAEGKRIKEVPFDFLYGAVVVNQHTAFKVKVKTAEIKIGGSHGGYLVVGYKGF